MGSIYLSNAVFFKRSSIKTHIGDSRVCTPCGSHRSPWLLLWRQQVVRTGQAWMLMPVTPTAYGGVAPHYPLLLLTLQPDELRAGYWLGHEGRMAAEAFCSPGKIVDTSHAPHECTARLEAH